jgi:Fic family protein
MFIPRYTISDKLLANIRRIDELIARLNNRKFSQVVLFEFKKNAQAVSAHTSTSIEGNPLPLIEVKKILKSRPTHVRDTEKEVINYNQALLAVDRRQEISLELILSIQKQITEGLIQQNDWGKLRQRPVVVNDPRTGQIAYLPPNESDVISLMKDLVDFVNNDQSKVDPILLAGIFHKQCVIIHPFMDGNGRTTRLITKILLAKMKLDTFNLFSFENYYNQNVSKYFQTVGEYGDYYDLKDKIDFTTWLEYFTDGLIDELLRVEAILPKTNLLPHLQVILNYIKENEQISDRDYAKLTNRARPTRALDFKKLINLGLIKRMGKGKATYYH